MAWLEAYVSGELEPGRRALLERHRVTCRDCERYLDSYRKTIAVSRMAFCEGREEEVAPEIVWAILGAVGR